jgi:hypothetical protein
MNTQPIIEHLDAIAKDGTATDREKRMAEALRVARRKFIEIRDDESGEVCNESLARIGEILNGRPNP